MIPPDVLYLVKNSDRNSELRWSLRSLNYIPHGNVMMAGYTPRWVKDVISVDVVQDSVKHLNALRNLVAALQHPALGNNFILMNDDFYILEPMDVLPVLHRGPLRKVIETYENRKIASKYLIAMRRTEALLHQYGHKDPLSYELHCPMLFHKRSLLFIVNEFGLELRRNYRLHYRTLYGNLFQVGGEETMDFKLSEVGRPPMVAWPFLSSSDVTFAQLVSLLTRKIPHKSIHEHIGIPSARQ